jgi:excinuclease ABC subunit C
VDGGKGQLSAAAQALERAGVLDLPIVSLAKREELVFSLDRPEPIRLPRRDPALRLLQRVRDEVHRFGIAYHRKRRAKRTIRSELLDVPGVGPTRHRTLLAAFGSVRALRGASPKEIAEVDGIGPELARKIANHLQQQGSEESA